MTTLLVEVSKGSRRQETGFGPPCMNDQPGNAQDIRSGSNRPWLACIGFIKLS
jgi:hypothetical protein